MTDWPRDETETEPMDFFWAERFGYHWPTTVEFLLILVAGGRPSCVFNFNSEFSLTDPRIDSR